MAGIVAASVAIGGVVGALVFAPAVGSAQGGDDDGSDPDRPCLGVGDGPVAAAADEMGIAPRELLGALVAGQTIAEVAEDNGVEVAAVIDAVVANADDHLTRAVENGWLTQAEADQHAAELRQHVTQLVNGELPALPRLHRGPWWFWRGPVFGHGPWHLNDGDARDLEAIAALT
ncbi:MAG TPA: hypothetical protein VE669_00765 [Actinomycetota bacterium]|jgi:hypothetical protein|nr:hypothetical protein [Actinomycetota bacterium]